MPAIDVIDSTWFAARPATVAGLVARPANWRRWWPGLDLAVDEWRGVKGVRWSVRSVAGTSLVGSAEVWLEPMHEGVVAHFFLRLDPADGRPPRPRRAARIARAYRVRTKHAFWALADELDPDRPVRLSSATPGGRVT